MLKFNDGRYAAILPIIDALLEVGLVFDAKKASKGRPATRGVNENFGFIFRHDAMVNRLFTKCQTRCIP